jgi:hypothetical protein
MNHETRAREIADAVDRELIGEDLADIIATAFREVEQETLERAAKVASEMDYPKRMPEFTCVEEAWSSACGHISVAIRALGTEGEET